MKKLLLLSILLPFSLFNMESGNTAVPKDKDEVVEQKQLQIIPGLVNDASRKIIEDALSPSQRKLPIKTTIVAMLQHRANLLRVNKSFLSQKELIDKQTIRSLKEFDPQILNEFLLKIHKVKKSINGKLNFANFLMQVGAHQIPFNSKTVSEAIQKNDKRWLQFSLNKGVDVNELFTFENSYTSKSISSLTVALGLIKIHPKATLDIVKLLLDKGANPLLKQPIISKGEWSDLKYNLSPYSYSPKRELKLQNKKLVKEYSSPEAKEIKMLMREAVKKNNKAELSN